MELQGSERAAECMRSDDDGSKQLASKSQRRTMDERAKVRRHEGGASFPDAADEQKKSPTFRRLLKQEMESLSIYPSKMDKVEANLFPLHQKSVKM